MRWITEGWKRIRSIGGRHAIERGLDEEIRFHLDQQTEKNRQAGMSPDEARREALLKFGGLERVKESTRDEVRPALLEDSVRDLRYGVRALRRAPGFTSAALVTLAPRHRRDLRDLPQLPQTAASTLARAAAVSRTVAIDRCSRSSIDTA